jgi:hypothetical protein
VFYRYGDDIYLGLPMPTTRAWLLNLAAEPHFTFHLKHGVVADLGATATVITDLEGRRGPISAIAEQFAERWSSDSPWPKKSFAEWLEQAPLAQVSFDAD